MKRVIQGKRLLESGGDSLFRRVYPLSFARLIAQDHCLVENPNTGANRMRQPNHPRQSTPTPDTSRELTSVEILQLAQSFPIISTEGMSDDGLIILPNNKDTAIRTVDELISKAMGED